MRTYVQLCVVLLFAGAAALAQPAVYPNGVVNAASFVPVGLPGGDIAQGSMFAVFGQNMGPTIPVTATTWPLPTSGGLGGVTVQVTDSAGQTRYAILLFVSAGQINAVLPSATALGQASIKVTYGGQTSAPQTFNVVARSVGLFSLNVAGSGPGVVVDYHGSGYSYSNLGNSAYPGDVVVLWGTGLGALPSGDETQPPPQTNLGAVAEVWVGGQQVPTANIQYEGRSTFAGEDQVNFQLPADVPVGCYVPVVLRAGGVVSNITTISIASSGGACSTDSLSASDLETVRSNGWLRLASMNLYKMTVLNLNPGVYDELASRVKLYDYGTVLRANRLGATVVVPFGTCTGLSSRVSASDPLNLSENPGTSEQSIDAHAPLNLLGPRGSKQGANDDGTGLGGGIPNYTGSFGPEYLVPGLYTLDDGNGSPNIGPYRTTLTLPGQIVWANHANIGTVSRSQDLTVTWTGGDSSREYVMIEGLSTDTSAGIGAMFVCAERASAGQFTIPSLVLSRLPASGTMVLGGQSMPSGVLEVNSVSLGGPTRFQAQGLDVATFGYLMSNVRIVAYQ